MTSGKSAIYSTKGNEIAHALVRVICNVNITSLEQHEVELVYTG